MNLTMNIRNRRTYKEHAGLFMIKSAAWIVVALFLSSLGYIAYHGAGTLSPSFLSTFPEKMMEEGGILPCIIGTAILSVGAMAVALPLGIACAVWLNEYGKGRPAQKTYYLGCCQSCRCSFHCFRIIRLGLLCHRLRFGCECDRGDPNFSGAHASDCHQYRERNAFSNTEQLERIFSCFGRQ